MNDHTPQLPLFIAAPGDPTLEIPYGYCQCGCGRKTKIAPYNRPEKGEIAGVPRRWLAGHQRRTRIEVRFWRFITRGAPNDCWEWQGNRNKKGYGIIAEQTGRTLAHRLSWIIHYDPIPGDLRVLHTCDNPPCCNPSHLFLGTQADNVRDMDNKGRRGNGGGTKALGELSHQAKLKSTDIPVIRRLHKEGATYAEIARRYAVSAQSINAIIAGKTWKHIS